MYISKLVLALGLVLSVASAPANAPGGCNEEANGVCVPNRRDAIPAPAPVKPPGGCNQEANGVCVPDRR